MHMQLLPEEPSHTNAMQTAAAGFVLDDSWIVSPTYFDVARHMTALHT